MQRAARSGRACAGVFTAEQVILILICVGTGVCTYPKFRDNLSSSWPAHAAGCREVGE